MKPEELKSKYPRAFKSFAEGLDNERKSQERKAVKPSERIREISVNQEISGDDWVDARLSAIIHFLDEQWEKEQK